MAVQRGKTICFIDNSNVFSGQLAAGWRIDWQKFATFLDTGGAVWQTYFFASEQDPPRAIQTNFYRFLKEQLRWEVVLYDLGQRTQRCSGCGNQERVPVEKGVDVGLATKLLMLAFNKAYETAILVSGDRDYVETIRFVKNLGLRVEIISWMSALSPEVRLESSSPAVYLDNLKSQIERT